eukprot:3934195-Rhodomonas_salina.1
MAGVCTNLWLAQTSLCLRINSFRDCSYRPACTRSRQYETAPCLSQPPDTIPAAADRELFMNWQNSSPCQQPTSLNSIGCNRKNTERLFQESNAPERMATEREQRAHAGIHWLIYWLMRASVASDNLSTQYGDDSPVPA